LANIYTLAPQPWLVFLDDRGIFIPNGQLAIYWAGTSTPALTYTTAQGVPHPFPISLDGEGRVPGGLYLQPGLTYKFVLHEPQVEEPLDGGIIRSQDHVNAVPSSIGSTLSITVPGSYVIDGAGVDVIEYVGVGDVTIRGITGGVQGQGITIQNLSSSVVWLSTSDPGAGPGNTLVNIVSYGEMPLVAFRANAHYTYLSGEWRMGTYEMGNPISPAFDPLAYGGAAGMTWTVNPGDVQYENFYLTGRTLSYSFWIANTSVGGTPSPYLLRHLPYGWNLLEGNTLSGILTQDAGSPLALGVALMFSNTQVRFERVPLNTPWTISADSTSVIGRVEILLR